MKKVLYFFAVILCFMGCIGGIGYTIFYGGYPIAVGIGLLSYFAFPKVKAMFNELLGKKGGK